MNNESLKHGLGPGYLQTGSLCYKAAGISSYLWGEQIHPELSRQVCLLISLSPSPHTSSSCSCFLSLSLSPIFSLSFQIWPTSFCFLSLTSHTHEATREQTVLRFKFRRSVGRLSLVYKVKLCAPPSLCQNSGAGCASSQFKNGTWVSIQPLFLTCLSSFKVEIAGPALNMPGFLLPYYQFIRHQLRIDRVPSTLLSTTHSHTATQ